MKNLLTGGLFLLLFWLLVVPMLDRCHNEATEANKVSFNQEHLAAGWVALEATCDDGTPNPIDVVAFAREG